MPGPTRRLAPDREACLTLRCDDHRDRPSPADGPRQPGRRHGLGVLIGLAGLHVLPGWAQTPAPADADPTPESAHSPDGRWTARAQGDSLVIDDAQGTGQRRLPGTDLQQRQRGRVQRILALPHRRSFLVAWQGLDEWWEVSWDPDAPPIFDGLVHDYRMSEAIATPGFLNPRRMPLPAVGGIGLRLEAAPPGVPWAFGVQGDALCVVHLDVRRAILRVPLPGARPADGTLQPAAADSPAAWWIPGTQELLLIAPLHGGVRQREAAPGPGARLRWNAARGLIARLPEGRVLVRREAGLWETATLTDETKASPR